MKLALGTVQFGLEYGISNVVGKTSFHEAHAIWEAACRDGVDVLDTAPGYGESEAVIGRFESRYLAKIVTKTPGFLGDEIKESEVLLLEESFLKSLELLNCKNVYALLIHVVGDLLKPGGWRLYEMMKKLKKDGFIQKVGVSVYTGDQIDSVIHQFNIDILQLPINILDQRLIKSGHIEKLKNYNIEVHARSVFLQGLLLMNENTWPKSLEYYFPLLRRYHVRIRELGLSKIEAALGFVNSLNGIDRIVCGVNSLVQWDELAKAANIIVNPQHFRDFACNEPNLVDPSKWL